MYINKEELAKEMGADSYQKFADKLGVDKRQLHRVLKSTKPRGGSKFLGQLKLYCQDHGLDFDRFIFLP
jgi:hypothetical protein